MERPRRHVRPPGALNDYLIVDDSEKKSVTSDGVPDSVNDGIKEEESNEVPPSESEKLLLSQPYKCGECKARYRSKVALLRHAVKHSGDKPFTCPECGRGLSSQCALSEHMNIHTNSRPHRCDECGQESRQLSVHLRHLLTHQPQPDHSYSCSVCAKTFKQNEYLRRHMRKHTGEKPFVCEECGKSFTCKSELNRHKKRHSSDRPHMCSDCGQTFKMLHNLRTHIKAHAGTQQWKCLLCSAVFSKPKLLEAHRKTHLESVQHLEVNRPNENTLIVTAEGDDRRKLPTVHNVLLPKDKSGNMISAASPQKKLLRINDTTLPLELILKSVGKGSNIKIKIIDKPAHPKPDTFPNMVNIVELIDEEGQELREGTFTPNQRGSVTDVMSDGGYEEGGVKTVNYEPVEVASVLSISASIESHCLSNHYLLVNPASEDYRCWLATCASLCRQLDPPFDTEVCKLLHQVTTSLQFCLLRGPGRSPGESPAANNLTSDLSCNDSSEYQFIYEQYAIIMGKLQAHFNYHINDND